MIRSISSDKKGLQAPVIPPPMTPGIQVVHETAQSVLTDSKVGEGSFGVVTWGYSKHSGSPVVAKKIKDLKSAKSEIVALKKGIPHTPRLREEFENDQSLNIVMDHVNQKDIFHAFLSNTSTEKLTLCEIRSIAYQALEFLAYLAERNLTYNDMKPENMIWKRASNCLTIVDLASIRDEMNCDDSPERTFVYVAPEVLLEGKVTFSTDIWSLGCVLFHLIARDLLFYPPDGFTFEDPAEDMLLQMVGQIGIPSSQFLEECDIEIDPTLFQDAPASDWVSRITIALLKLGAKQMDVDAWIKLLSSMLCYENRATAQQLLTNPLFGGEIRVKLISDPTTKCTMLLQGVIIDFHIDKNRCLHIPRDPKDSYTLILKNQTQQLKIPLTLKSGDVLDITPYQAKLASTGESSTKRARTISATTSDNNS